VIAARLAVSESWTDKVEEPAFYRPWAPSFPVR